MNHTLGDYQEIPSDGWREYCRQFNIKKESEEESAYFKQIIKECTDILMRRT